MSTAPLRGGSGETGVYRWSWGGFIKADISEPIPRVDPSLIISDAYGTHDAVPRGVPNDYSWKYDSDADPNVASFEFQNYEAVNVWGQLFAIESGSGNFNVRVQVRSPRLYFFDGTNWTRPEFSEGSLGGAFYTGTFLDGEDGASSVIRAEGEGVYSVPLSAIETGRDAMHWWWDGMYPRVAIPANCQGILASNDIRLVPDDGFSTIDGANFIANSGVDTFATLDTVVHPQGWNPGIPQSRMTLVTGEWDTCFITTVTSATLNSYPPPIPALTG